RTVLKLCQMTNAVFSNKNTMAPMGSFGSSESFHQMTGKLPSVATHDWLAPRQRPLLICTERCYQHQPSAAAASDVSQADEADSTESLGFLPKDLMSLKVR
ncbi:hypothetical protein AB2B41_19580, partial [Marimonas sp. MJW-29]